jgi:endonuclease/exonuclease/phosphatase (EEP) superfamily protein YafD
LNILSVHLYSGFNKYRFNLANKQIETLKNLIKNINQNLIVIGDLNMTNVSKRFINFLEETNVYTYTSYIRPTFTWPAYLPGYFGIQIDHVLFSENIKMVKKKTAGHLGSDHRALIVDLIF